MAVLDTQILGELQEILVEPNDGGLTWPSGLWTAPEVVDYLNQRQRRFLQETQAVVKRSSQGIVPAVPRQAIAQNWVATRRVAYAPVGSAFQALSPGDQFEMDQGIPAWATTPITRPALYSDADPQTLEMVILPPSVGNGTLHFLFVEQPVTLTGAGTPFSVPDEFVPTLKWGALEDMLSKVGRAHDPIRAQIAGQFYSFGVEAAKALMGGFA